MKKVLLPLLMFVLLSSVVFSALTDSEVIYLNFTADGNDYWETYDFTCTGVDLQIIKHSLEDCLINVLIMLLQ